MAMLILYHVTRSVFSLTWTAFVDPKHEERNI